MDPFLVGIVGIVLFVILLAIGVHIGVALGLIGVLGLLLISGPVSALRLSAVAMFHFATNPEFVVIPAFSLMGLLAMYGGISETSFSSLKKITNKLPGALGIAAVFGCAAFGAVCGSSMVTATVFSKVSSPEMRRNGYEKRFSYGIVATAGIIGMLIPPSTLAVVYGLITGESIAQILMAGIGPGIILTVLYSVNIILMVKFKPSLAPPDTNIYTWKERLFALKGLWPAALSGLFIIGGIYGGIFTATEAAAWGALIIAVISFVWGHMRWKQLWNSLRETVSIMAMIFLILGAAQIFSRFMALSGVTGGLANLVVSGNPEIWQVMIGLIVVYIILGCFLDSISMLLLTMPIIYPIIKTMGIEPIWFAIVIIMTIESGLITPPIGLNVYGVKSVAEADVTLEDIFIGAFPFLFITLALIALVCFFPQIATWIPSQM